MARPKLQAQFFIAASGQIIIKAKPLSERIRHELYLKSKRVCNKCDRKVYWCSGNSVSPFDDRLNAHIDHIFPRARGGQNNESNLQILCVSCNSAKGAK